MKSLSTQSTISLHQIVNGLQKSFTPLAVNKWSFIINDVDARLHLHADEATLAFVVGKLLINAINSSRSVCIRVEARQTLSGVQIRVRHNGASFHSTVANSFVQVMEAARKLGGSINIYNQRNEGTVITFYLAA
jgi:Signal transduction histidine kinase